MIFNVTTIILAICLQFKLDNSTLNTWILNIFIQAVLNMMGMLCKYFRTTSAFWIFDPEIMRCLTYFVTITPATYSQTRRRKINKISCSATSQLSRETESLQEQWKHKLCRHHLLLGRGKASVLIANISFLLFDRQMSDWTCSLWLSCDCCYSGTCSKSEKILQYLIISSAQSLFTCLTGRNELCVPRVLRDYHF